MTPATGSQRSTGNHPAASAGDSITDVRRPGSAPAGRPARGLRFAWAVLGKLLNMAVLLLMVSVGTFLLLKLVRGDAAATAGGDAGTTAAERAAAQARLGLDQPVYVQYLRWMRGVLQGDFGSSYTSGLPVGDLIVERLPVTIALTLAAVVIAVPVATVLGLLAGSLEGTWVDRVIAAACSVGIAIPTFWFGLLLALYVALGAGWFPATGFVPISEDPAGFLWHIALPGFTLAVPLAAALTRQLRGSVADVLTQDYIRSAEARGISHLAVLGKHTLKNAAIPALTVLAVQMITLIGGTIVVEAVFGMQGIGSLVVAAVTARDVPVIQGVVLSTAAFAVVVNVVLDATYRALSPRTTGV